MTEKKWKPNQGYPYLENTTADHRLIGASTLMNPKAANTSSQRATMLAGHLSKAQIVAGVDLPRLFTGYEKPIGDYSYNPTRRDYDIIVKDIIPVYKVNSGAYPIMYNPSTTVIYQARIDNDSNQGTEYSYLNMDKYTSNHDGYGWSNTFPGAGYVSIGNYIAKDIVLSEAPTTDRHIFKPWGTNLNVAYISLPHVTEDAVIISQTAAKKLQPEAFKTIERDIKSTQIPLNLYGNEENYKFMPDVGETVRDDGVLCTLRTPGINSIIHDLTPANLAKPQYQHDFIIRAPAGSQIMRIDVWINRNKIKQLAYPIEQFAKMFAQAERYREQNTRYCASVYNFYNSLVNSNEDGKISPKLNTLITSAIEMLIADGQKLPRVMPTKSKVSPAKKKEVIEFLHIEVTYQIPRHVQNGFKITGRHGNKGVISRIVPDEYMPTDDFGFRADICIDPNSPFARLNTGQLDECFISRIGEMIRREMVDYASKNDYTSAWNRYIEFLTDCNPKFGNLVAAVHQAPQQKIEEIQERIRDGIYVQQHPFQSGLGTQWILRMRDKYNVQKTPVVFTFEDSHGNLKTIRTKKPVLIGSAYFFLLDKMPYLRACSSAYISQFNIPTKASSTATLQNPYPIQALRIGEDERRNLGMVVGGKGVARLMGEYANNREATTLLANHLLTDTYPSQLTRTEMSVEDIIKGSEIIKVANHVFSTCGISLRNTEE